MSHDAPIKEGEAPGDEKLVPQSVGIANGVRVMLVGAVLLAIMQGAFVEISSDFGHVWPAADSAKIDLPPSTF
jgi:hypothetical protein